MMNHLFQLAKSGRFQKYDLGKDGNMKRYGMKKPPQYNLTAITSPMIIFWSATDGVSGHQVCNS
jgi:hypothetical protein